MASKSETLSILLGPLDHIAPCNIPQSIIYLGLKQQVDPQDAFVCLREGLRRTIHQAPWLNGRVYFQSPETPGWRPGQLEIRYKSPPEQESSGTPPPSHEIPLRFHELPSTTSYDELREAGFPWTGSMTKIYSGHRRSSPISGQGRKYWQHKPISFPGLPPSAVHRTASLGRDGDAQRDQDMGRSL
ncbi:hypothetical protein PG997_014376 [Apiospora hydei]|uniref:Uncharacterized protein n=1 Tax=Apiospora hydei TaxID=1337664 RepID=A0ABR1UTL5_9PEZI